MKCFSVMITILLFCLTTKAGGIGTCDPSGVPGPISLAGKDLQTIRLLQPEMLPSPYDFACRKGVRKSEMPSSLQRSYPRKDIQGHDAHEFLRLVVAKAQALLEQNKKINESMLSCIDKNTGKASCATKALEKIQEVAAAARAHHSLDQALQATINPGREFIPSSATDYDGFGKAQQWKKYSDEEMKKALQERKSLTEQVKNEISLEKKLDQKRAPKDRVIGANEERLQSQSLENIRLNEELEYNTLMANYPVLQYISSEKPSATEIRQSFEKLESNRQAQQQKLNSFENTLDPKATQINRDSLWVLKYRVLVEETLQEHPEFCTLAAGITRFDENVERVNQTAAAVGMVAGTLVMPYAVGFSLAGTAAEAATVAGVSRLATLGAYSISSVYWTKDPLLNYLEIGQAARVGAYGEQALQGQEDVSDAQDQIKTQLMVGLPMGVATTKAIEAPFRIAARALTKQGSLVKFAKPASAFRPH